MKYEWDYDMQQFCALCNKTFIVIIVVTIIIVIISIIIIVVACSVGGVVQTNPHGAL